MLGGSSILKHVSEKIRPARTTRKGAFLFFWASHRKPIPVRIGQTFASQSGSNYLTGRSFNLMPSACACVFLWRFFLYFIFGKTIVPDMPMCTLQAVYVHSFTYDGGFLRWRRAMDLRSKSNFRSFYFYLVRAGRRSRGLLALFYSWSDLTL